MIAESINAHILLHYTMRYDNRDYTSGVEIYGNMIFSNTLVLQVRFGNLQVFAWITRVYCSIPLTDIDFVL